MKATPSRPEYHIFYEEPDKDRWLPYDRYPRSIIRRIIRGPEPVGGVKRWFVNLCLGLDELKIPYTVNNYSALKKNPEAWALVIGKPHVIGKIPATTNIIFGPGIASHPSESDFLQPESNIRKIIISSDWFRRMYNRDLQPPIPTAVWPAGIETERWKPAPEVSFRNTILVYDKIRWDYDNYRSGLIDPIIKKITDAGIHVRYIRYGQYKEKDFQAMLQQTDGMIFLCEHETQGFAYLQTLSSGVPILAWDRTGYWQDPSFYPHLVQFGPVTSVPYWDGRCGERFEDLRAFYSIFDQYWKNITERKYKPRNYILENLTLADCAARYISIVDETIKSS